MNKTDISRTGLYISNLTNIIKSEIVNRTKITHTTGRHSDAFVYILGGSCTYVFDDGDEFCAKKGDILYLANDSVYDMYINSDYSFIFCDFDFSLKLAIRTRLKSLKFGFFFVVGFKIRKYFLTLPPRKIPNLRNFRFEEFFSNCFLSI